LDWKSRNIFDRWEMPRNDSSLSSQLKWKVSVAADFNE
jgi:hypothetical protein